MNYIVLLCMTMALGTLVLSTVAGKPSEGQAVAPGAQDKRWFKGNTHTHTLNSDGDSTPDDVVRWYREHGYHFLVLSDHNFLTSVDALNALHGADQQFLVIRGEEVSDRIAGKPVHVNGLNLLQLVKPQGGATVAEVLQGNVDAVRQASGVPHINHPNYEWAISVEDMKRVERYRLFEIYNGHPFVNNEGGGGYPSLEQMWDELLTSGKRLYGLAVDDAHTFKRPWAADAARPGRGWVTVHATRLSADALLEAMERGDFYASTGVELKDYEVSLTSIAVTIREEGSTKYRVRFTGKSGRLLKEVVENPAVYRITGDEGYVRAKVLDSNGKVGWMQPHFVGNPAPGAGRPN